jgi:hypothetical protein
MTRWLRLRPSRGENARAASAAMVIGAGVGAVAFYVLRILMSRDAIRPLSRVDGGDDAASDGGLEAGAARKRSR